MRHLILGFGLGFAVLFGLAGCLSVSQSDQVTATLDQLGNTLDQQLLLVEAEADAATPPAPHLHQCAAAGITVQAAIQKLFDSTKGQVIGAVSVAAMGTLLMPGSAQFNWAKETLLSGCIDEVADMNQSIASDTSIFSAISVGLQLAPVVGGALGSVPAPAVAPERCAGAAVSWIKPVYSCPKRGRGR